LSRADVSARLSRIDSHNPSEDDKRFIAEIKQAAQDGLIK
jgi:hypothetical protein